MPAVTKVVLSKSTYLRGCQCLKSLYLYKNHYDLRDAPTALQQALFDRGHQVGKLAHKLFPGGVDCSVDQPWKHQEALEKTAQAIADGHKVLYEAAFSYYGVIAILDILVKRGDDWHAFEVKSSVHLSGVYFRDAALQYYVINNTLKLKSFSLITIDNTYVRKGPLSVEKLFKLTDITNDAKRRQGEVKRRVHEQITMLQVGQMPNVPVGKHCHQPYPCDYMSYCWADNKADDILKISGLSFDAKMSLIEAGHRDLTTVPPEIIAQLQPKPPTTKRGQLAQQKQLKQWLGSVSYPLVFFDIEFLQLAVPEFDGTSPYESLPFMLSAHRLEHPDAEPVTFQHILGPDEHPFAGWAESFVELAEGAATLMAYDDSAELRTLRRMADYALNVSGNIELANQLKQVIKLVKDLRHPFVNQWIIVPEIGASTSLKKVLPALCPGQDFNDLAVNDGFAAARRCEQVFFLPDGPARKTAMAELAAYAERDTWAMYQVWKAIIAMKG